MLPSNSILAGASASADLLVDTKEVIPVCSLLVQARTGSPLLSASAQLRKGSLLPRPFQIGSGPGKRIPLNYATPPTTSLNRGPCQACVQRARRSLGHHRTHRNGGATEPRSAFIFLNACRSIRERCAVCRGCAALQSRAATDPDERRNRAIRSTSRRRSVRPNIFGLIGGTRGVFIGGAIDNPNITDKGRGCSAWKPT